MDRCPEAGRKTIKVQPSKVDLGTGTREQLVRSLNVTLASALDLGSQVKQAHWNIRGPQFYARHLLFDKLAERLVELSDKFAERAATLGGYAEGTARMATANSILPEYDRKAVSGTQHVRVLASRCGTFTAKFREFSAKAAELGDPVTEELYIEALRGLELDLWFLESQAEG